VRKIDQRVVVPVVDAVHDQLLEDEASPLVEDLLAVAVEVDVANGERPGGLTRDGGIRRILEPIALLKPIDQAALKVGQMTGDTLDLGILDCLDDDVVADPIRPDLPDHLGPGRDSDHAGDREGCRGKHSDHLLEPCLSFSVRVRPLSTRNQAHTKT
jgi:hypothetical protein